MFWLVAIGGLLYVGYEVGLFSWLSSFAYEEKLLPLRMASLTTSILAFGLFVGRVVTGVVVDKFGLQRTLVVLGTISLVGFSIAFFAGNSILLSLGVFITGLGFSGTFPTLQAIIVSGYRQNREAVLAIFAAAGSVGAVTTNILVGGVSDRTNLAYGMSVIGVQIAAALLIFISMYLIQRKRKKLATP
jgi:fucose permease